jgi:hypothetical protein
MTFVEIYLFWAAFYFGSLAVGVVMAIMLNIRAVDPKEAAAKRAGAVLRFAFYHTLFWILVSVAEYYLK